MKVRVEQCTTNLVEFAEELAGGAGANTALVMKLSTWIYAVRSGIVIFDVDNRGKSERIISLSTKFPQKTLESVRERFYPKAIGTFSVKSINRKVVYQGQYLPVHVIKEGNTRTRAMLEGLEKGTILMSTLENTITRVVPVDPEEAVRASTCMHTFSAHSMASLSCWPDRTYGAINEQIYQRLPEELCYLYNEVKKSIVWLLYYLATYPQCHKFCTVDKPVSDDPEYNYVTVYSKRVDARGMGNRPKGDLPAIPENVFNMMVFWIERYLEFMKIMRDQEGQKSALYKTVGKSNAFFTFFVIEGLFGHLSQRKLHTFISKIKQHDQFSRLCRNLTSSKYLQKEARSEILETLHRGLRSAKVEIDEPARVRA